jgi:chemotaxis methyl-accepting protein methylase
MSFLDEQVYGQVKRHLERSRGVDLTGYSPSFVMRAIKKRMGRSSSETPQMYARLLMRSEEETNELLNALSINVTEFFRDKGAFESFQVRVLRPLLDSKIRSGGGILRIWDAGCATGQETYTLAIGLAEEVKRIGVGDLPLMSIVGTDISRDALAKAKSALYSQQEVESVPEKHLSAYFVRRGGYYEVIEPLRRRVRFHLENLLDKPSSKFFDAIVCRNVLIYFSRPMHETVVQNLYDSLRVNGFLMLGRTEALMGEMRRKFEVVDQENRILLKVQ